MNADSYMALIRTFNSEATLPATLSSLAAQTVPPHHHVVVDSGSTDASLQCLPVNATVHRFTGERFNYSEALNQGLDRINTRYVLIISSHTEILNIDAMEYALRLLAEDEHLGAAYFCDEFPGSLGNFQVDDRNFNGFNGIWNNCAVIKTALLQTRRFRPEVFSAEDQEWSKWLVEERKLAIACISGARTRNNNPLRFCRKKRMKEYLAIAFFVDSGLRRWSNIARIGLGALLPTRRIAMADRYFRLCLSCRLLAGRVLGLRAGSGSS